MNVEQRLAALRPALEKRGSQIKNFGSIACFTDHLEMAGAKLPTTACFQEASGYLNLSLRREDQKHLSFESVKQLLEKAVPRRK